MTRLGVVMDPIDSIKTYKDSSFAMLLAAQARGWTLHYLEPADLYLRDGHCHARWRPLTVRDDPADWFTLGATEDTPLSSLDVVLMRQDPPFDTEYLYTTHLLSLAEREGCLVVNRPQALREANEKLATAWFPQCCAPSLVSRDQDRLRTFLPSRVTSSSSRWMPWVVPPSSVCGPGIPIPTSSSRPSPTTAAA